MTKHTKGPWRQESYRLYANQTGRPEYPIHAPKRGLIAKAIKQDDARLIAAAPELLEALEALTHSLDLADLIHDDQRAAFQAGIAAIAKAEGVEQ